jgi:anti-sigma factor RsiW
VSRAETGAVRHVSVRHVREYERVMNTEIDELKLTAYALGELQEGERADVEAHLEDDPAGRAHVDEVRTTARLLSGALAEEEDVALTPLRHVAIERRLREGGDVDAGARLLPRRRNWGLWASVAASTLIVCTVMATVIPSVFTVGRGTGGGAASRGGTPDNSQGPIIFAPPAGDPLPEPAAAEPPGGAVTVIEVEKAPERVAVQALGTRDYPATNAERKYLEQTPEEGRTIGSIVDKKTGYDLTARRGKRVAWFGVVREIGEVQRGEGGRPDCYELLLEHKYFDGATDLHILALSFNGAGDFKARVWTRQNRLPLKPLMLVRVYGTVREGKVPPSGRPTTQPTDLPTVEADYARVFPWKTFTFIDAYGKDATNPRWRRLCEVPLDNIYDSTPTDDYYRQRLGKEAVPADP